MKVERICFLLAAATLVSASLVEAQPRLLPPSPTLPSPPPLAAPPATTLPPGAIPYESYYAPNGEPLDNLPEVVEVLPIQPYVAGPAVELYPHVVYRDQRKIAPHAVPYLVEVPLPAPRRRGCVDCAPPCALVKICVPPCATPCVTVRRRGFKMRYDFGKFEVDVVVRRGGRVIVDYDA